MTMAILKSVGRTFGYEEYFDGHFVLSVYIKDM